MHQSCFVQFSSLQEPEGDMTELNVTLWQYVRRQDIKTGATAHLCKGCYNHVITMTGRNRESFMLDPDSQYNDNDSAAEG